MNVPSASIAQELTGIVIETLNLELSAESVDPDAPLFGAEGLGLDSIDMLEIALEISKRYGFQLRSDDENNKRIFANLNALARHVELNRAK